MGSKLQGSLYKSERSGKMWSFDRFVHSSDIAAYTYVEGDDASAITGEAGSYIYDYKKEQIANHFKVKIVAVSSDWTLQNTKENNKNGTIWEFNYRVPSSNIASYTYVYGADASLLTGVGGSYILRCSLVELPNYFLVKINAATNGYENSGGYGGKFTNSGKTFRSYDEGTFMLRPSMFGARVANQKDVDDSIMSFATGAKCKVGEYIYWNATSSVVGTKNLDLCPLNGLSGLSDAGVKLCMNVSVPTRIFKVTFLTLDSVNSFYGWHGVNGSFGSGTAPATTVSGKWLAIGQTIQENEKPLNEIMYTVVNRVMKEAPTVLGISTTWDSSKNGGVWSW